MPSVSDVLSVPPLWIALIVALFPAALHWSWTRTFSDRAGVGVVPERHLAIAQRMSAVTALCTMGIVILAGWSASWILSVEFVALSGSTYRMRRALFAETWPFHRYLTWRVRVFAAMFGFWLFMVVAASAVAAVAPPLSWGIAGLSVAIALAWHHWHGRVLLFMLGATRLERPDLDVHFQPVFDRARVPRPPLWRAGMTGGVLANAFALPTLSYRGVLFFDTLLEQLPADEITAILGHEVAHLEQFNPRRLRGLYLITVVTILLLLMGVTVASVIAPELEEWTTVIACLASFAGLWLRARRMQSHETDADLRAIELCENPEALVRALTRIYEINHIPRRWSVQAEERATHPSLAGRIRAIRQRAGAAPADTVLLERLVIASSEPGRCATVDRDRVGFFWIDGDATSGDDLVARARRAEVIAYDQLSELRIDATRGALTLRAVDHHARRWSMSIRETDIARVQSALDRVDHMIVAAPSPELGLGRRIGVLLLLVLASTFNAGAAVLVPALLALRRPTRRVMMGLAMALTGTAILTAFDADVSTTRMAVLAILALLTLWSVRRRPQHEPPPTAPGWLWIERAGFAIPSLIGLALIAASAHDLFGLHTAVRDRSWFAASILAMATFLLFSTDRPSRRVGRIAAVIAATSIWVGSPWFLVYVVGDPLVAEMPSFTERTIPLDVVSKRSVDGEFSSVRLTPDGQSFLLSGYDEDAESNDDEPRPQRFLAGGFDGWSREVHAFDARPIDNRRLLRLDHDHGSSRLTAEDLRTGEDVWTLTLPNVAASTVEASPSGAWRAIARRANQFTRIEGRIGTAEVKETLWTIAADRRAYVDAPRVDGGAVALGVATIWEEPAATWLSSDWRQTTRLLRAGPDFTSDVATSHLRVECPPPSIDGGGYVCVSFDGRSSRFWRFDPQSGDLLPLGQTRQIIWGTWQHTGHRIAGTIGGLPVVVALDSGTLLKLTPRRWDCWINDFAVSADFVVTTCTRSGSTSLMRYHAPQELR